MATAASPAPHPSAASPAQHPPPLQPPTDPRKALTVNALRLKAISDRLRGHLSGTDVLPIPEFVHLVYAFARGIDFAVSAGDIPVMASDIPGILRKIYELTKETFIQSSLMVLVISCKNACSKKWFQPADSSDITRIANELSGNFCTSSSQAASDSTALEVISQIMPRYYPRLKFERLITSIEAKVGYDVLMSDFFIERNLSRDEKIRLIVVQKENLDASTCVTSPPHVSFLVNGKGVDKRTNVSMDLGPQFPSDITKMLKYGANIIQAVGYFNANYIIAVAFVNNLASFSAPKLDDYTQPITVCPADSDVLEGPSRVSLNCPISLSRIKTPIKGRLCKHYQCFDYDNYMEMNSKKPNWRCPYCNTPSNFTDLRIDQKMAKILEETGDDVPDVLVFADGSWKAAPAHDEKSDRHRGDGIHQTGDAVETDLSSSEVIDLINGDGDLPMMDWASALEDTKPLLNSQDISVSDYLPDVPMASHTEDLRDGNNGGSNMAYTSRQNLLLPSTSGLGSSSFGTLESILPQNVLRPVITDAVSPLETSTATSGMQHVSQETHCETVQLQPQIGPVHRSEVRSLPIPRNPRREPAGVQALPVPPQNPGSSTRLQPNILNCPPPIPLSTPASSTYQAHQAMNPDCVIAPMNNSGGPLPRTPGPATSLHLQSTARDMRQTSTSSHLPSRVVGLPAPHLMGARLPPGISGQAGGANNYRPMPMQQTTTHDQLRFTQTMNQTALAAAGQTTAAALVRPTQSEIRSHILPTVQSQAPRSQSVPRAATTPSLQRAAPHLQPPSVPPAAPSTPQAGSSDSLPTDLPVDENWCPTGQMRGSLTGNAYSSAILRYQPAQARPSSASGVRRPH